MDPQGKSGFSFSLPAGHISVTYRPVPSFDEAWSKSATGATAGSMFGPWGTVIGGVAGLASSFLGGGGKKPDALPQNRYDIYGRLNTPNTGAISSMEGIFRNLNAPGFQDNIGDASKNFATSLGTAANDPGLHSIYNFGQKTLNGDYLSSPLVNQYANQAYTSQLAAGADQAAQTRARYARAGLGFSTTNEQAENADMASAAGRGALARSGILAQNYQNERQLQQQAPGVLSSAISQPLSYLSQIPSAYYAPLQMQAGLTTQLAGGQASTSTPTYYQEPNFADKLAGGVQQGAGLASILNGIKRPLAKPAAAPVTTPLNSSGGGYGYE